MLHCISKVNYPSGAGGSWTIPISCIPYTGKSISGRNCNINNTHNISTHLRLFLYLLIFISVNMVTTTKNT
jgi:hypothetical protein